MRVVTLKYPATTLQHSIWSGMDQRQHGEPVTPASKRYGCIRFPGEESSSHINLLLEMAAMFSMESKKSMAVIQQIV